MQLIEKRKGNQELSSDSDDKDDKNFEDMLESGIPSRNNKKITLS